MRNIARFTLGLVLGLGLFAAACAAELNPNTQGQIASALEAKKAGFEQCYQKALDNNRDAKGRMALVLEIDKTSGEVTQAKVDKSDIGDAEMQSCVAQTADEIKLPEPPNVKVEGRYDIDFGFEG